MVSVFLAPPCAFGYPVRRFAAALSAALFEVFFRHLEVMLAATGCRRSASPQNWGFTPTISPADVPGVFFHLWRPMPISAGKTKNKGRKQQVRVAVRCQLRIHLRRQSDILNPGNLPAIETGSYE